MQRTSAFAPGWLRAEIRNSIEELARNPRIPQEIADSFRRAEKIVDVTEALRRSEEMLQSRLEIPAGSSHGLPSENDR
jgi:DNA-directed RNA polymerase sigma subunit (sigma70/sigma32)